MILSSMIVSLGSFYFEFPLALIVSDSMIFVLVRSGGVFESRLCGSSCPMALP